MQKINPILTREERDILLLTAVHPNSKHLSIREIGARLGMPLTKVKTLIHQACVKLGADNRNEAVLLAMRRGEIKVDELLTLDELAEILSSLDSEVLRKIAKMVRQNRVDEISMVEGALTRRPHGILTNRERDVLILASYGLSNIEIATRLCMTTSAVRTFLNRAFRKLGACKKADAVQLALKQREISIFEISTPDMLMGYLSPLGPESIEKLARLMDENCEKVLEG